MKTKVTGIADLFVTTQVKRGHVMAVPLQSIPGYLDDQIPGGQLTPPLTVMHVVLSLSPGGTERLVIELCTRLWPAVQPVVCCLDGPGDWSRELTEQGIPVHALERTPGFHPSLGWHIARLARRYGASVLHCHHYSPFVYGVLASRLMRDVGVVLTEHGRLSNDEPSPKRRLANVILGRGPGRLFAVSADLKRHMVAEGFPERRVGVIHNGIELGVRPSVADRERARRNLGWSAHEFVCGTVGRLDPVKHLSMLIDAHAALRASCPNLRLAIVGGGPERSALEELAHRHDIGNFVTFLGHRDDVRQLLPAFDAYVNCSLHEGISLTILEAMAATLPVIATRVGGNPEIVVEGETGMLISSRATDALVSALAGLMRDRERCRQMGEAGRQRIEHYFDIRRMVGDYRREYERATGTGIVNDVVRDTLCVESAEHSPFQVR
jgi:glycosyltransferase involved in cell wall biosynthesis